MGEARWRTDLKRRSRLTRRMLLESGDAGQIALTKVGGAPWWPKSEPRPQCPKNQHPMSFMAQVALGDVALLGPDGSLLSFHYCDECAHSGFMSFGAQDAGDPGGYDLRLFRPSPGLEVDGLGAATPSSLPSRRVSLSPVEEIPGREELGDELRKEIPSGSSIAQDDFDENVYPGLVHVHRSKVGGWPTWVQSAEWPTCETSGQMVFVAQIDSDLGRQASWGGGGYAYLFCCPESCSRRKAELVLQTT